MNIVVPAHPAQACKACDEELGENWAIYDLCLEGVVCGECRLRMILVKEYLNLAGIRSCIQVSGGKPLK